MGLGVRPAFRIALRSPRGWRALLSMDETRIGEAYMRGDLDFSGDFLAALDLRRVLSDRHPLASIWRFVQPWLLGDARADKTWVPQHYDYGNDFYFAFLDRKFRLYSQALYHSEDDTLEQAAQNKLDWILDACRLEAGGHVLDVGGGWGSFAGYAGSRGVHVTMLTISREQYAYLSEWCATHSLPGRLRAVFESIFDYEPVERYDAIVLLGVMEHLPDYPALFRKFEALLKPGRRLYMDFAAGRRKFDVSAFTYRYIFPGDHTPVVLPELFAAANRTAIEPIALHNDRHSYFLTLQAWARNLEAAHEELAARFGERVYRLFQIYLWAGAHLHRDGGLESYRVLFQKARDLPSAEIGVPAPPSAPVQVIPLP
ncbi:MAG TPA: class I SAM-dependent methyltransferase [Methylomirabilota bacterium]|nr:class I SAM-dependent methyltransferase [Methylomirabilota bacterium]